MELQARRQNAERRTDIEKSCEKKRDASKRQVEWIYNIYCTGSGMELSREALKAKRAERKGEEAAACCCKLEEEELQARSVNVCIDMYCCNGMWSFW